MKTVLSFFVSGVLSICFLSCFVSDVSAGDGLKSDWQLSGRLDSELSVYNHNGEGGTTKDEGLEHQQNFRVNVQKVTDGVTKGVEVSGRATDDAAVDSDAARLLYLQAFYENERFQGEFGDVAGSYNPYVYSAAVKGARIRMVSATSGDDAVSGWEWETIAGTHEDTWREFYDNSRNTQPDRLSAATNYKYTFAAARSVNVTLASVHDRPGSAGDAVASKAETIGSGVDWRFNRWSSIRSEGAITVSDSDLKSGDGSHTYSAMKHKLLLKPLPKSLRNDISYERIAPGYNSVAGSSSADMERIENVMVWTPIRELRSTVSLRQLRDNLEKNLSARQATRDVVLDLVLMPRWMNRGEINSRIQRRTVQGRGTDTLMLMNESGVSLRPFAGFRFGPSFVVTTNETKATGVKTDQYTIRNRFGYTRALVDGSSLRGNFTVDRDLVENEGPDENIWNYTLDFGYDYQTALSADMVFTSRETYREINTDTYYSSVLTRLSWYPRKDRSRAVTGSFERREYDAEGSASDYSEDIIKLVYSLSF